MRHAVIILLAALLLSSSVGAAEKNLDETYEKEGGYTPWGGIFWQIFDRIGFGKSYALVVGVGDYDHWTDLEAPLEDAKRVRDFLIHDAGFDHVVTLTNGGATKSRIERLMLEVFPSQLGENDRFFLYFSGHGTQREIGGDRKRGYLPLQPAQERGYADMISMLDIQRWSDLLSHTRQTLFVLDACFSGLAGVQRKAPLSDKALARLSQYGHHLITAGTEDEESVASLGRWGGSLFTTAFLKAASGRGDARTEDYPRDGVISLKELTTYVEQQIDTELGHTGGGYKMSPQIAELQDGSAGEFFFIAKAHKNRKVGAPDDYDLVYGMPETKGLPRRETAAEDVVVWATIQNSRNPLDFRTFLKTYPDSPLAPFARTRLAELEPVVAILTPPKQPAPVEEERQPVDDSPSVRSDPPPEEAPQQLAQLTPARRPLSATSQAQEVEANSVMNQQIVRTRLETQLIDAGFVNVEVSAGRRTAKADYPDVQRKTDWVTCSTEAPVSMAIDAAWKKWLGRARGGTIVTLQASLHRDGEAATDCALAGTFLEDLATRSRLTPRTTIVR